jgi:hypothetical protein
MSESMVERVARAMAKAAEVEVAKEFGREVRPEYMINHRQFLIEARAAISAIRIPTETMLKAGYAIGPENRTQEIWEDMVDAALKEGP